MMKVCKLGSYSIKTVTIVYINTTFRNIVFIAYQASAYKASHCHCIWNLSHNHNMLYNIVSFQSSSDIQNCIFASSAHILLFKFNFTTFIWPNTCSIFALERGALECGTHNMRWAKPAGFSNGITQTASPYKHTLVQWFVTWVNLALGVNFMFQGGKFTEP